MVVDPSWLISPPEENHTKLVTGAGSATTLANMAVWLAEMVSHEVAFSASTVNGAATMASWDGQGAIGSATSGTGLNTALQLLMAWVTEKGPICQSAVTAYETALSTMFPAPLCVANRTEEAADVIANPSTFWALTPRIGELNFEYHGVYWPHNSSAGVAYGTALALLTAALAIPPPVAPMGGNPAAPAGSAAAVAQTSARGAAGEAMRTSEQAATSVGQGATGGGDAGSQIGSLFGQAQSLIQPATQLFQMPMQAFQQIGSAAPQALSSLTGMFGQGMGKGPELATETAALRGGGAALPGSGAGAALAGAGGGGGYPGAGLTSYTRPASSFSPENSGRPTGLRGGLLEAAEVRGPTATGMGGGGMPMSPAGMLQRSGEGQKDDVTRAKVIVDVDRPGPRRDV